MGEVDMAASRWKQNIRLTALGISPGLALGKAFIYRDILQRNHGRHTIDVRQVNDQYARIEQAIEAVRVDLKLSAERIEHELNTELADVFRVHEAMLNDPSLMREIREELERELVGAEQVIKRVFYRWEQRFHALQEEVLGPPTDDIADLGRRLLRALAGVHIHPLENVPAGSVLVAKRLLPSDTVFLSRRSTLAIVLEFGGPASHAALLTREMGIPAVAQITHVLHKIDSGDMLLVDGFSGTVVIEPDVATRKQFEERLNRQRTFSISAKRRCHAPAKTRDGVTVRVMANIGCREDVQRAVDNGADGIGLYRIESLYLLRKVLPCEQELFEEIKYTLAPVKGMPIDVRLLDVGGDKYPPFLNLPPEDNPFLGRRGVRILLDYPELLYTQLRALLRLSQKQEICIVVPMITLVEEMAQLREILESEAAQIGIQALPRLGAMIETPAAALCVADIAKYADFLCVGTNDLTQYTLAAGRENPLVSKYFIEDHPAMFRLLRIIIKEAADKSVGLCGEMAGYEAVIPTLVKIGFRNLSVAPPLVPLVKQVIRETSSV